MTAGTSRPLQARRRWLMVAMLAAVTILAVALRSAGQSSPMSLPDEEMPVVVLDPGRGGSNLGARGPTGLLEKDITLQLAMEAGRLIEELLGVRVVLTRTDDSDVALDARAALANQAGGDLFISICAGGSLAATRRPFQTFYFDDLPDGTLAEGAPANQREFTGEAGGRRHGAGTQPLLWDQAQVDSLDTSQMFARLLYNNLHVQVAEEGRGVFGLPVLLLRWVRMPAVLLDIGSLNDPGFEAKVREDAYLQRAALGIAQAINDYQAFRPREWR